MRALEAKDQTPESCARHVGYTLGQIDRWVALEDKVTPEMQDRVSTWLGIKRDEISGEGFLKNDAGGTLGGISSGQDILVSIALKPTSSITTPGRSVDVAGREVDVITKGRHDPCVGIRAVPIAEAMTAGILTGWLALLIFLPLAVTSNDLSVRKLGRRWKALHRLVYVIAILGVWHYWWQVKQDIREPLVYALILAGLLGYRLWYRRRSQRTTLAARTA